MSEYKPNSHKYREERVEGSLERKKVEKAVSGKVKVKKKNEISKFKSLFISEEATNVKDYLVMDVLLPAVKNTIEDIVTNGIRMILRGDTGSRKGGSNASRVSYSRYYDRRDEDRHYNEPRTRVGYNYDDIILESRGEAEDVISRMDELIDTYGMVTVADLYDLVGITGNYTDNKYGWTNIRNAEPVRVRDGYMLKLPKVLPINSIN